MGMRFHVSAWVKAEERRPLACRRCWECSIFASRVHSGFLWRLLGVLVIVSSVTAQSSLDAAYEALSKRLTVSAQRHLQAALGEKDSLIRAEAALLQGILAIQGGREKEALSAWYLASQLAPGHPVAAEATFHRAHLLFRQRKDWSAALYLLRSLIESAATPPDLRAAAEDRLRYFAYGEADAGFLWAYMSQGAASLAPYLGEALLYHLRQACLWHPWRLFLRSYAEACGTPPTTENVDSLLAALPPETLRVAILLPFMASSQGGLAPMLEFWQGGVWALERLYSPYAVWEVRVYDTERNPLTLRRLLDSLTRRLPHVLIGEISFSLNQIIADWCQRHAVWHAIPINHAYPNGVYTFPMAVPATCIGENTAYAVRTHLPGRRGILLVEAEDPVSGGYAEGFLRQLYVPTVRVPGTISAFLKRWTTLRDSLMGYDWYGLVISNEEVVGFLLTRLGRDEEPLPTIIGMESWLRFQRVELKDFRRLVLWIPQTYLPDSIQWQALHSYTRELIGTPPTAYQVQGYDVLRAIAHFSAQYSLGQVPAASEPWGGVMNIYQVRPDCKAYRWCLWEYRKGLVAKLSASDGP